MGKYCTNCGSELHPGARFCAKCGAAVFVHPRKQLLRNNQNLYRNRSRGLCRSDSLNLYNRCSPKQWCNTSKEP